MISVDATKINMKNAPEAAVKEGSEAEYECETDSAYPDPPVVLWYVDGVHVHINDEHATENSTALPGDYHGQMTKSVLRLKIMRTMNQNKVKCVLENDDTKLKEHDLSIKCKYLLGHL